MSAGLMAAIWIKISKHKISYPLLALLVKFHIQLNELNLFVGCHMGSSVLICTSFTMFVNICIKVHNAVCAAPQRWHKGLQN